VLLGYGAGKNEIVLQGQGTGGLDDFASQLKDDQVQFGVVELVVKGVCASLLHSQILPVEELLTHAQPLCVL